jgi:staphylococcal nuclease domain-containing protein 1
MELDFQTIFRLLKNLYFLTLPVISFAIDLNCGFVLSEQKIKSHTRLMELQAQAKENHRGMWSNKKQQGIRSVITKFDAVELFEKIKGKHTPAIVEQVRSGSTLRIFVPSTGHSFQLLLSGVQSPLVKPHVSDEQQIPWARASRFFAELHVLHRDVEIVLESLDKANNFYGSVVILGSNLGVKLLEAGLARFVDWSATKTANVEALKKAEKSAQTASLRLWAAGVTAPRAASSGSSAPTAPTKRVEFWGQVTDIINAGTIQVVEFKDGQKGGILGDEHRINFSSLQAARLIPREKLKKETDVSKQEIVAAYEARNFLRKKLIGQKVRVVQDYYREANKEHNIPERAFFTVYFDRKNVGLELVSLGFAAVSEHKESDARSPDYQEFIVAESKAKKRNLGLYAKAGVNLPAFNDLSDRDSLQKEAKQAQQQASSSSSSSSSDAAAVPAPVAAVGESQQKSLRDSLDAAQAARLTQFLPHVQGTRLPAVIERVFGATRFKVWVDKIQCMLPVSLACVRAEKTEASPGSVPAVYPSSKGVGNLAYNTVRSLIYLRDVEILIDSVDRTGSFNASVFINGKDLSATLIQDGLVKLLHAPAKRTKLIPYEEFRKLEDSAKSARKGVWLNWDEADEERRIAAVRAKRAEESGIASAERKGKTESFSAQITEIIDCSLFYFRRNEPSEAAAFSRITADLQAGGSPLSSFNEGQLVSAQFASDQTWYRARIVKPEENDQFLVYYIDYGNSEIVSKSNVRALPPSCELSDLPAQAQEATLAYIKCPTLGEEYGPEAADYLKFLVWEKPVVASIHWTDGPLAHVVLGDPSTSLDVNGELLRTGYARVPRVRGRNPVVSKMREFEDQARSQRLGIWQYGDIIDSDEE